MTRNSTKGIKIGKREDLTDKVFTKWTVLGRDYSHSDKHRKYRWWTCRCECGKIGYVRTQSLLSGASQSCGCISQEITRKRNKSRVGKTAAHWKRGWQMHSGGYKFVSRYEDPILGIFKHDFEHRVVAAIKLGRRLKPGERVHHKNAIRTDNRPENLEVWTTAHPTGARISDLKEWAKQFLLENEPEVLSQEYKYQVYKENNPGGVSKNENNIYME